MGETSSRTLVTLDMEQHQDLKPGYTANGHTLTQESSGHSLIQKRPVTYDTGGQEASASRPSLLSEDERERLRQRQEEIERKRITPQFESRAAISERVLGKGKQRSPPEETSVEEESSTKNVIAPKEFKEKEASHLLPKDNAEVFLKHQDKKISSRSVEKIVNHHGENGHFHAHAQEDFRGKEDTANQQTNKSAKEYQSHSQTDDITTSVDQVPASENSPRQGDQPPLVDDVFADNCPSVENARVQEDFTEKGDTGNDQNISIEDDSAKEDQSHSQTDDITTSVDLVPVSENSSIKRDKPPQDFPAHTGKPDFSPGNLVSAPRYWGAYHHNAICIDEENLVHLTSGKEDCLRLKKPSIKVEKISNVFKEVDYPNLRIENGTWEGKQPFPVEKIIDNAISEIGKEGFNPLTYNCEHFARKCRYGEEVSREAENHCLNCKFFSVCFGCLCWCSS